MQIGWANNIFVGIFPVGIRTDGEGRCGPLPGVGFLGRLSRLHPPLRPHLFFVFYVNNADSDPHPPLPSPAPLPPPSPPFFSFFIFCPKNPDSGQSSPPPPPPPLLSSLPALPQVSWIRNRDSHILTVDRYTFISDERFSAWHEAQTQTWTLQVRYVQERDAGKYECQVSTEPKMSHFVELSVISESREAVFALHCRLRNNQCWREAELLALVLLLNFTFVFIVV